MANLNGFDPDTDLIPVDQLQDIDKWALSRMNGLVKAARSAYDNYEFHIIYHGVNNFCTTDMSKLYVDITKDRVYTEKADSEARRSAQTAMWYILSALTRLIAPMISFTAEEIWREMPHLSTDKKESVFLCDMPSYNDEWSFPELEERWNRLFDLRDDVMKALEIARANKLIGKSLDAKITLYLSGDICSFVESFGDLLPTVFIVSDVEISGAEAPAEAFAETDSGIAILVEQAEGEKCDSCWMYTKEAIDDGEGRLCPRCKRIIDSI
jgi:isoleucyl-tRNA synthetase